MARRPNQEGAMEQETPTVVVGDESPSLTPEAKKPTKAPPKWETTVKDRLKVTLKRFSKPLAEIVARDANEGDTRLLVTDFLCDGLGFDKFSDLTTEYQVKGEFADYGVRIDGDLVAFVETKRATTKLAAKHLRQVEMYAVNEGVEWMILTNGPHWLVYHLTGGLPVQIDLAIDVNLLGEETLASKVNQMFYVSREALKRRAIDDLWKEKAATSPKVLAATVLSDAVVSSIRKELRRRTDRNIAEAEIARLVRGTLIRPEALP